MIFRKYSSFVLNLLGPSFIDKNFLPSKNGIRAKFPALIFAPTTFVFLLIDYASLAFFDHLHNVKIGEMTQEMKRLTYFTEQWRHPAVRSTSREPWRCKQESSFR